MDKVFSFVKKFCDHLNKICRGSGFSFEAKRNMVRVRQSPEIAGDHYFLPNYCILEIREQNKSRIWIPASWDHNFWHYICFENENFLIHPLQPDEKSCFNPNTILAVKSGKRNEMAIQLAELWFQQSGLHRLLREILNPLAVIADTEGVHGV